MGSGRLWHIVAFLAVVLPGCQAIRPHASLRPQASGPEVAAELQRRFDDLATDCGSKIAPPVQCSGLLQRATSAGEQAWLAPGRPAGISFSWLRQDSNFLTPLTRHGFIVYPEDVARSLGLTPLIARCVYYKNATTSGEPIDRCRTRCDEEGILSAQQFNERYPGGEHGCSFRAVARQDMSDDTANAWMQMPAVRKMHPFVTEHNEVIVGPYDGIGERMPVEAFYYTPLSDGTVDPGLPEAKADQIGFKAATGRWVPVIRWLRPANIAGRATFEYIASDQAITR